MSFCPFCGAATGQGDSFCTSCGRKTTPPPADSPPPPVLPRKKRSFVPVVICLLLGVGFIVTGLRLLPYWVGPKSHSSQPPTAVITPEVENQIPTDPVDMARRVQNRAEQAAGVVFGRDDTVDKLQFRGPRLKASMREVERSDSYQYKEENCTDLFTDVAQQAALAVAHEVAAATSVSADEENKLGKVIAEEIEKKYKGKLDLPADSAWRKYAEKLGLFLAKGARRKGIDWEFHIIHEDIVNAFAIPGGNIYVYTGLLKKLENEAQLAGVLAHEITHVDLRHCVAVFQVISKMPEVAGDMAGIAARLVAHPFQGRVESEADRRGLERIYEVGYSPAQVVRFWEENDDGSSGQPMADQGDDAGIVGMILGQVAREVGNVVNDHPDAARRACLLRNHVIKLHETAPRKLYYVGKWNLQARRPFFEETK